jgi:methionyl-tRNA formyltransferase
VLSNPPRLRLGFAGTPEFAVPALARLAGLHDIVAVFTQPDRPAGRGQALSASPVKKRALELGLTVHQPASFKAPEVAAQVRGLELHALIVAAYGLLLPGTVLCEPKLGCINIHASLLPRWRGAAPIQRALLAGDAVSGVTLMQMEAGLDTGPMLASRVTEITAFDNSGTLHDKLAALGADLIAETLPGLMAGTVQARPQPSEGVTHAAKIRKSEARIRWEDSALQIWRRVRAFNPWPVAETRLGDEQLRIWEAQLVDDPPGAGGALPGSVVGAGDCGIDVACGGGTLRILRLQLAGRKTLSARDFLKSHKLGGIRLDS